MTKGFGIASLVLGILSIPLSFSFVGPILAILGIIFAIMQNKKIKTGLATAGLILSIIGLVAFALFMVLGLIFVKSMFNTVQPMV